MQRRAAPLRFIAVRLAVPELEAAIRQPGVAECFRVTIQYHDGRHPDQVATLSRLQSAAQLRLSVHYRRANDTPLVLEYTIDPTRYAVLNAALRKIGFDKLDDYEDIPWHGADLWLVERAAGSFHHDIMLAPDDAKGPYAEIVNLVQANLKEAIRAINNS